jgi:hypothetical protein
LKNRPRSKLNGDKTRSWHLVACLLAGGASGWLG